MSPQNFLNFIIFNSLLVFMVLAAIALWLRPTLWLPLFTLFLGFIVGWLDLSSSEVSSSVLMLLMFGFFAGFAQPRRAWLSALLLGIWVPVLGYLAFALRVTHQTNTELITSWLPLVFSFAGAYAGFLARRLGAGKQISAIIPEV